MSTLIIVKNIILQKENVYVRTCVPVLLLVFECA